MARSVVLNTGQSLPAIGFGTSGIGSDEAAQHVILTALQVGYRLIDTARIYANERAVGAAIRDSGISRQEIFLTTKVWNDDQGYDRTLRAFDAALERLGQDYVDLYLVHWPATTKRHDSWRALERLYSEGRIKAAGVSNYTADHLGDLLERSQLVPAVNQVEFHPFIYQEQRRVLDFCAQQGIAIEAYSPLSRVSKETLLLPLSQLAQHHHKTPQQIILRWCIQHGTVPLPRSATPDHIRSNFDIFDFKLSDGDMAVLDDMNDGGRVTWDPSGMGLGASQTTTGY